MVDSVTDDDSGQRTGVSGHRSGHSPDTSDSGDMVRVLTCHTSYCTCHATAATKRGNPLKLQCLPEPVHSNQTLTILMTKLSPPKETHNQIVSISARQYLTTFTNCWQSLPKKSTPAIFGWSLFAWRAGAAKKCGRSVLKKTVQHSPHPPPPSTRTD